MEEHITGNNFSLGNKIAYSMKKFYFVLTILLLVGCKKQDEEIFAESYSPIFEASIVDIQTKTYLDGNLKLLWHEGDEISIFNTTLNKQYKFNGITGENSGTFSDMMADKYGTGNATSANYAVYPYKYSTQLSNDEILTVILPSTQNYEYNSFGKGANTMVAVTSAPSDRSLIFKNLGGYLKLYLYGDDVTIKSITLKGNNNEKIAGECNIIAKYGQSPSMQMTYGATSSISLDCGPEGVRLGASAETATEFWIVVPPVKFENGFTIEITDVHSKTMTKATMNDFSIERNTIKSMSAFEFKAGKRSYNFKTVEDLNSAISNLYRQMIQKYYKFGQGYNGEGTIKFYLGNYASNHWNRFTSMNTYLLDNSYHINSNSNWIIYPWYYYYGIIANANAIIVYGPDVTGNEAMRDYIIAQAKVMRAYCYMQLSQRFHYRWSMGKSDEAKNGNGLRLRLDTSTDPISLSSANDTYAQIIKDLTEAIPILETETFKRNWLTQNYQINKDVAYAVYARAALIKGDYATAALYAQKARKDYPLMSNRAYFAGFNNPTSEWIWSSIDSEYDPLYYYSFFAYHGFQSNTSAVRNYPISIGKQLYESIPMTDVRKDMWLAPRSGEENMYSQTDGQVTDKNCSLYKRILELYPSILPSVKIAAWHQMKFQSRDGIGVGDVNHFRSSEMYLIEAECQYMMGNESAAQALLEELNVSSGRDPQYSCDKTGKDLFAEIKKYRQIELWGEGFDWFDLKRWNDPIDRKNFSDGGNSYSKYAIQSVQDQSNNWWTSVIPENDFYYGNE